MSRQSGPIISHVVIVVSLLCRLLALGEVQVVVATHVAKEVVNLKAPSLQVEFKVA